MSSPPTELDSLITSELLTTRRRECGLGWAVDIHLPRCLSWAELEQLTQTLGGSCRRFGNLIWLDLADGRITASLVTPRLTLRPRDPRQEGQMTKLLQAALSRLLED
ncbi:MAG: hypothetical protein Q6M04_06210 [Thermostichus sp. BF3_bins_97]